MVRLELTISGDYMEIEVIDRGRGMEDVARAMEPAYSTDPERMGLGFAFMQSFMDKLSVESTPQKGTRVKMIRRAGVPRRAAVPEQ
jgi:stage II sporulation protein AB (anti-sigma F factor)